ncbi:hypothetical protein SAMN05421678_10850 [Actinopolymorpha cephalotaxi]|uniref:DUF1565 domain-containing protein n=1 Tax=Actinopolymorpha cephalotaxi TaxID=504797 RepID=A0A1I2UB81_9ACTN|nr:hypothetical protein [Actinopolymorpha cephalotaxi]NYH86469.1 hypothetical protein [Actinopolymorpha cephalotaxi]SFG72927.1 hypothetical protein SAMN05421678_10850 [Actinopolymorpha cephalotaxi]
MLTRRTLLRLVVAAVAVLVVSLVADRALPPASAGAPHTLYVDSRIGDDGLPGTLPDQPLASLSEALRRVRPGTQILMAGYGDQLPYLGTGVHCPTVQGTAERPVVIRRNVYTNILRPVVLTTATPVTGPWTLRETTSEYRTWSAPWPDRIRLAGDPDYGFVKIGAIALTGYAKPPRDYAHEAAWWSGGRLYLRSGRASPHDYGVTVKNGDALCLSGRSRHVQIDDLMVVGAVHAIRVEPGAQDIRVDHFVRHNVLDKDLIPVGALPGFSPPISRFGPDCPCLVGQR